MTVFKEALRPHTHLPSSLPAPERVIFCGNCKVYKTPTYPTKDCTVSAFPRGKAGLRRVLGLKACAAEARPISYKRDI